VVQDADDGTVLMLGYMNREAVAATLGTGAETFFSRSRGRRRHGPLYGHARQSFCGVLSVV
jgi:phosphoribosyl-AMP cyclohydrolase